MRVLNTLCLLWTMTATLTGAPAAAHGDSIELSPHLYGQLKAASTDAGSPRLTVPLGDGSSIQLHLRPMKVWEADATINIFDKGELVAELKPPAPEVWVDGMTLGGGDSARVVSAVARVTEQGTLNLHVKDGATDLRWRSDPEAPRTLVPVRASEPDPDPDPVGADSVRDDPTDGIADDIADHIADGVRSYGEQGVTDRIRFGHLGAEISVVVDSDAAGWIFAHNFEGATNAPYDHVSAWVTDLFAHLNKPFRRDLQLSMTIASLDIHLGHGEPWDSWIPNVVANSPNLANYGPEDRKDVVVAWIALRHHWLQYRAATQRDAVLLLYAPDQAGDGGGYVGPKIGRVCDTDKAYAVVKIAPSILDFPTLPPGVAAGTNDHATYFTTAHELGHVFGAEHTHPTFDQCNRSQTGQSTIMSYCKQRMDEFRPVNQVRVRDVVERAQCLEMLPYPVLESLHNGVPVQNLDVSNGYSRRFSLQVPAGADSLEVRTSGGSGDAMLYVLHRGREAGRSTAAGTGQQVLIPNPAQGEWEVWLHGQPDFHNVTLEAHLVESLPNGYAQFGLAKQRLHPGQLTNYNSVIYTLQVPPSATRLVIESSADPMVGGGCGRSGDADLYLGFENLNAPLSSTTVNCSEERIVVANPSPGTWYAAVHAASDFQNVMLRARWDEPIDNGEPKRKRALQGSARPLQTGDAFLYRVDLPPDATELTYTAAIAAQPGAQSASVLDVLGRADGLPSASVFDVYSYAWTHLGPSDTRISPLTGTTWYFEVVPNGQQIAEVSIGVQHDGGQGILHDRVPFGPLCSSAANTPASYQFEVPADADSVRFALTGGTGNADLYVLEGTPPANPQSNWTLTSVQPGNDEVATQVAPTPGTWYVVVAPNGSFCDVHLTASTSRAPYWDPDPLTQVALSVPANGIAGDLFPMAARAADDDGDPLTYTWDFGDGTSLTQTIPGGAHEIDHQYVASGSYVVSVSVDDDTGAPAINAARTVTVTAAAALPPVIQQTVIPGTAVLNGNATFEVFAHDPAGLALDYGWQFKHEHGTSLQLTGARVDTSFPLAGIWHVVVTVTNSAGAQATARGDVTVP